MAHPSVVFGSCDGVVLKRTYRDWDVLPDWSLCVLNFTCLFSDWLKSTTPVSTRGQSHIETSATKSGRAESVYSTHVSSFCSLYLVFSRAFTVDRRTE